MEIQNYFDNAATTPLDPRVLAEMLPFLELSFGNADSLHAWGAQAHAAVDRARARIAEALGVEDPSQILFTSGATESNNWVLSQHERIAVSPFEHSAVLEPAKKMSAEVLRNEGLALSPPSEAVDLLSVMTINNEVGFRLELPLMPADGRPAVHRDITQEVGKFMPDLTRVDFASFSAHKFYGPKGVGGLYAADPSLLRPLIMGGQQQGDLRGGTLNVPGIVGMGAAAAMARESQEEDLASVQEMRAVVLEGLGSCPEMRVNGGNMGSPYILSLSFLGVEGEPLVLEVDRLGYAISSGAACSTRSTDPSHVLLALNMPSQWLRGTIRISFGRFNTREAAAGLGRALREAVSNLRNLRTI